MSEHTGIAWASMTASPWFGCTEVSPGCAHCYARQLTLQKKWAGWGDNSPRVRSKGFWEDAYRYDRKAGSIPLLVKQGDGSYKPNQELVRPRMFTSLMDWLDPKAPIEWLADFLKVIHDCQNLDWLLLTKRPELFKERLEGAYSAPGMGSGTPETDWIWHWANGYGCVPQNVWFGVSVENQKMAEKRIPILMKIPARIRWLSVEPLLEQVNLQAVAGLTLNRNSDHTLARNDGMGIDWVVVGGESGSKRRDCGVDAISKVAYQCINAGVPIFVKQDCAQKPGQRGRLSDDVWALKQYPNAHHA